MEQSAHRETPRHHTWRVVKNGACIEVTTMLGIPSAFEFYIETTKEWHNCTVTWHSGSRIGVEFA